MKKWSLSLLHLIPQRNRERLSSLSRHPTTAELPKACACEAEVEGEVEDEAEAEGKSLMI